MLNGNKVYSQEVLSVDNEQTAIITSKKCGESFCFGMRNNEPFYNICLSSDVEFVKEKCKKAGYPRDFILDDTNKTGETYVIPASSTNAIALCVEEVERNGKWQLLLSKVRVVNWEPCAKRTEKQSEENPNEKEYVDYKKDYYFEM